MQQQVMKRNMSSELGWGSGSDGGWGQQSSIQGSGSWTSTANQENSSSASSWQAMGKSDSASDAGDDTSSVKSGSTITNMSNITPQSQDSSSTSNSSALQTSSSSPWSASNPSLPSMDSSPWGNSNSPAPSSIGSIGWSSNPSSLSLSTNQGHNSSMSGSNIIGSNSAFSSTSAASPSTGWPTSMTGSSLASTSTLPPSISSGLQTGSLSSQWQGSSMLGNIGEFSKTSDSGWSNPTSSLVDNKDISANSDPRMWGLTQDKSNESHWETKSQWGNTPLASGGDQAAGSTELSFAQATLKGLKVPPATNAPQAVMNSRQEEILRAIENHEGWGSRPIRQDTSWDIETSPKSHRKFSSDSSAASNVWNNSNGTAIWEAVRENQNSSCGAGNASGSSWNAEKDQSSWGGPSKPPQDPNSWNVGNGTEPKAFGNWGGAGDASNKMWGQKTEVGSWGETGGVQRPTSISSWGDDGDAGGWEDRRITGTMGNIQGMVPPNPGITGITGPTGIPGIVSQSMPSMNMAAMNTEATPWNEGQKPGWNSASTAAMNRTKMDEPWNKPPPVRSGWGDPVQDVVKVDDGTGLWSTSAPKPLPPQTKAAGWGETGPQSQWNATVGAKPKAPAGWDEASWAMAQRAKSGRYPDDESTNSVEVGYWNGLPQDNNTWNDPAALRGVRKITGQQMPPKYMGSSNNHPPTQMRAKLLQQLMDLGFRKEEAQHALITNNLNLDMAINDLKTNNGGMARKDMDVDMFQANGPQSRMPYMSKGGLGGDEMTDIRPDQVPPFSNLPNTPFPNAQVPNQTFMQSSATLPPSSLNPSNSSINSSSLQQKLMQKMQQQQAPPTAALGPRGQMPPVGSGANNQVPPQQQQQILAQLRQAVSNGFISPQLLNYQLPHNILVLLQQLLQCQTALQNVMNKQQQLMQQARATGNRSNPQLEQMQSVINNINQQIISVQKQLQQAQTNLFISQKPPMPQPPSGTMTPQPGQQPGVNMVDNLDALSSDLATVALQTQVQSRLNTQWKLAADLSATSNDGTTTPTTPSTTTSNASDENGEKALGGKSILQSSSSPNLNLIPGGLGMTGDKTWSTNMSTSSSSNWPLSSSESAGTNSQADPKTNNLTSTSTSSILSGIHSGLTDVISEFVPGKPWQGLAKNVEDDPHLTPGSIQLQRSLSVNRVHDESLNNLDGHKLSSWSTNMKNDSLGLSQLGSRPPPGMAPAKAGGSQQWQSGTNFTRQTSWPHSSNSAFTKVGASNWNDRSGISSWILLKNLNPSMDITTVRAFCGQHGPITTFHFLAQAQIALVQYSSREVAYNAQQRLHNFQMGSSIITAEFIGEAEAQRVTAQIPPPQPSGMPPMNASPWSQAPPAFQTTGVRGGDPWASSMPGTQAMSKFSSSGGDPWNLWDVSDHNSNPLLSNILGGESM